jgi:hypothetical protein
MTAEKPFYGQPSSFDRSELSHRFGGILRTGGMESAGGRKNEPQRILVYSDDKNNKITNPFPHTQNYLSQFDSQLTSRLSFTSMDDIKLHDCQCSFFA